MTTDVYTVPAGKRLMVEYFGGAGASGAAALFFDCPSHCGGALPVVLEAQGSGVSVGSEAVRFAVPAGDVVRFTGESSGAAAADVALGGHLEPAP